MLLGWLKEGLYILDFIFSTIIDIFSEPKPPGLINPAQVNVVLLYGFMSTPAAMIPLQQKLQARGCNVLIPDLGITIGDIDYHAKKLVDFFRQQDQLLRKNYNKSLSDIKDQIIIFGYSMGGLIAIAAQRMNQDIMRIPIVTAATPLKGTYASLAPAFWSVGARQMITGCKWLKDLEKDIKLHPRKILHLSAKEDEIVDSFSSFLPDHPSEIVEIVGHIAVLYETEFEDIFKRPPG